jgi:hypothetical protein
LYQEEATRMCICAFGKRLFEKSYNEVVFLFVFHIAVQQPHTPTFLLTYQRNIFSIQWNVSFPSFR